MKSVCAIYLQRSPHGKSYGGHVPDERDKGKTAKHGAELVATMLSDAAYFEC